MSIRPIFFDGLADHPADVGEVGHVAAHHLRLAAGTDDLRHHGGRRLAAGVVVDHGAGALAGEGARGRGTDAGRAACHQDDLAFEILHRLFPLLLECCWLSNPRG
jgi:hypothetical protein